MKKILFVCVENSNRSQMAQAFALLHGKDQVEAHSAGSAPSGVINPKAIEAMKLRGYDLSTHTSKSIDAFNGQRFDYTITLGCGDACPFVPATHRVEWNIPDPRHMSETQFNEVRDLIEQKVIELLHSME